MSKATIATFAAFVLSSTFQLAFADPILSIEPAALSVAPGETFTLYLNTSGAVDLYAYQFDLSYDASILQLLSITEGTFLAAGGPTFFIPGFIDNSAGLASFTANTLLGPVPGVSGSGEFAVFGFHALSAGVSPLTLANVILLDSNFSDIPATLQAGQVSVEVAPVPEPGSASLLASSIIALWLCRRRLRKGPMSRQQTR